MSRPERYAAIRAEVQRRGHVPSVRRMALAIGIPHATIAKDYLALGLRSRVARGRPPIEGGPSSVALTLRIPTAAYDAYCRAAAASRVPVREAIRAAVVSGARTA